jgi:hypothetical protein
MKKRRRQSAAQEIAEGLADWEEGCKQRQPQRPWRATFMECLAKALIAYDVWPTIPARKQKVVAMRLLAEVG